MLTSIPDEASLDWMGPARAPGGGHRSLDKSWGTPPRGRTVTAATRLGLGDTEANRPNPAELTGSSHCHQTGVAQHFEYANPRGLGFCSEASSELAALSLAASRSHRHGGLQQRVQFCSQSCKACFSPRHRGRPHGHLDECIAAMQGIQGPGSEEEAPGVVP